MCYLDAIMNRATLAMALCLVFVSVGCQSKEQAALHRAQNRKPPGHLRILNLTDQPATLSDHTRRPMNANIKPGTGGIMNPGGEGEKKFTIKLGSEDIQFDANLVSDEAHTAIIWPSKKVSLVGGEMRRAKDMDNLFVAFVDENGPVTGAKATILSGARKIEVTSDKQRYSVTPGEFKTEDGAASITIAPEYAYSLIFVKQGGKFKPFFLLNSDPSKPVAGGAG